MRVLAVFGGSLAGAAFAGSALALAALALAGCVDGGFRPIPGSGEWKVENRADQVANRPQYSAILVSRSRNARVETETFAIQYVSLQLLCFDHAPVVRFEFTHKIGANRNSRLAYRFDSNPGRDADVRILQDFRTIVIEDPRMVKTFVDELRGATQLHVQVSSLNFGMTVAEFKVEGAPVAIDAAYSGCPAQPPQRTTDARQPRR